MAERMGNRMDKVGAVGAVFAAPLRGPVGRGVRHAKGCGLGLREACEVVGLGPGSSDGVHCAGAVIAEVEWIGAARDLEALRSANDDGKLTSADAEAMSNCETAMPLWSWIRPVNRIIFCLKGFKLSLLKQAMMRSIISIVLMSSANIAKSEDLGGVVPGVDLIERIEQQELSDEFLVLEGALVDGPRAAPDQPIDYTALLHQSEMVNAFLTSIYGCSDIPRACESLPLVQTSDKLSLHLVMDQAAMMEDQFVALDTGLQNTVSRVGIDVFAVDQQEQANITLFIADLPAILAAIEETYTDPFAAAYFELAPLRGELPSNALTGRNRPMLCYASTILFEVDRSVNIWATEDDFRFCIQAMLMNALGLFETDPNLPSVLSVASPYSHLTELDETFLEALFHPEFPKSGSFAEVAEFARSFYRDYRMTGEM